MEIHGCATLPELKRRMRSSLNVQAWISYLELKDELEAQKMKALLTPPEGR